MTSPRGSWAAGPAGGDDGSAGSSGDFELTESVTAEATLTGGAPSGASPADAAAADAATAGGAPREAARTAGTTMVEAPGRTPDRAEQREAARQPSSRAAAIWALWLPPAVAFIVSLWGITTPSFWRDEAATIAAIKRPLGDLIRMLGNVDAVHGAYYLMMWPIAHVLGTGALVLRLPSAVAVAIGAAAVAATGRRLISSSAGLSAGLIYAVLPAVSRYGQEARSYAMVMAVAAISSHLLVRILGADPARQRRWIIWYGVSIAALGILNIFGLLLVPAHAVTLALYGRGRFKDPAFRRRAASWAIAVAAGVAIASPLLVLGWRQRSQIAWLSVNTSSSRLSTVLSVSGSYLVTTAVLAVIAVALVLGTETSRQKRRADWPRRLAEVSLPWLIVPPLVLLAASVVQPVYTSRYILICVPALALIAGAAVASYGRMAGAIALLGVLIAGAPTQASQRTTAGHYDDILTLDHIVAATAKPGDYVLYTNPNSESFGAAYPFGLGMLRNIDLKQGPIASRTLAGTNVPIAQLKSRLSHAKRVWVVEINALQAVTTARPTGTVRSSPPPSPTPAYPQVLGLNGLPLSVTPVLQPPWRVANYWHEKGDYLILFTRP